jgi:mycothiol synthase
MSALDPALHLRAPRLDDAGAVAEITNLTAVRWSGEPLTDADEVRAEWTDPERDLAATTRVVETSDGTIVGSLQAFARPPLTEIFTVVECHPDHAGRGINETLVELAEEFATDLSAGAPAGKRTVCHVPTWCGEAPLQAVLEARGFEKVRTFWVMITDFDEPPAAAVWPAGVTVRAFDLQRDVRALYDARVEVFKDHWGEGESTYESWKHRRIDAAGERYDPSLWFVAMAGDEIVGFSLCEPRMVSDPASGYVAIFGVRRAWRRQGIAKALLLHSFAAFWERGLRRVSLHVDAGSLTGATRVYASVGMREHPKFEIWERELRPAGTA